MQNSSTLTTTITSPTSPSTILEPVDQEIGELYAVRKRHATDFEASKLWNGGSGDERGRKRVLVNKEKSCPPHPASAWMPEPKEEEETKLPTYRVMLTSFPSKSLIFFFFF